MPANTRLRDQWPFGLVLLIVAFGLLRIVLYHWRDGTALIGGALVLAAVLRAVLPDSRAGLLAVRKKRKMDVLLYGGFGAIIVYIAGSIIGGPFS